MTSLAGLCPAICRQSSRHENDLPGEGGADLLGIDLDRVAAQQILERHIAHFGDADLVVHELVKAGEVFQRAACLAADAQDIPPRFCVGARNGKIDFVDAVLFDVFEDIIPPAHDGHAVEKAPPLVRVVVDDAARAVGYVPGAGHIVQNELSGGAGADQHDAAGGLIRPAHPSAQRKIHAVGKPAGQHQHKHQDRAAEVIRQRHSVVQQRDAGNVEDDHRKTAEGDAHKLGKARVLPYTPVQTEEPEHRDRAHDEDRHKAVQRLQVFRRNHRVAAVEPYPESENAEAHRRRVVDHEKSRDDMPSCDMQPVADRTQYLVHGLHLSDLPGLAGRYCVSVSVKNREITSSRSALSST